MHSSAILPQVNRTSHVRLGRFPLALIVGAGLFWLSFCLKAAQPETFVLQPESGTDVVACAPAFSQQKESREIAGNLAKLVGEITGHEPTLEQGGQKGVVLAIGEDFPEMAREASLDSGNPFGREDYLIRTSSERLLVLGATPLAIRRAVADLLHRWGYRQFFPGKAWEIIPRSQTLTLRADEVQHPAYVVRDMFTSGFLPGEREEFNRWLELNRMGKGFQLNTRHSYQAIYKRNKAAFEGHPDYFASVNGEPQHPARTRAFKFNAANRDLLQLLVDDAKSILAGKDAEDSISMDPSDFGGWDNSGVAFKMIGSPSNQAVTMANRVAREAAAPLHKYVGMYAYSDHQFPPDIAVEPNIIVSFATRFLRPDQELERTIRQWKEKGVIQIGIRDYSAYWGWDQSMPGRALGGNLAYLQEALPRYYQLGARCYTTETQASWGAYGLGLYMTTRLLWNPQEEPKAIVSDFLEKSFGPAVEPMARFYRRLNGEDSILARYATPAEFYTPLLEAMAMAEGEEAVRERIGQLLAYVRYMELLGKVETARVEEKQDALLALCDWVFRIAPMRMLPTQAMTLHPRNGFRSAYQAFSLPPLEELKSMLKEAAHRPVALAELVQLATIGAAQAGGAAQELRLKPIRQATTSPWLRNAIAFVFPLESNSEATASLTMRRFGFSGYPRYLVRDSVGTIVQRGRMEGAETKVKITSLKAGSYTLILEPTQNLIRCRSESAFLLVPAADFHRIDAVSYRGSFYFTLPAGGEAQIFVGGQKEKEKINASVQTGSVTLAEGENISGTAPLIQNLKAAPLPELYQVRIDKPTSGYFEDLSFGFYGGYHAPVALSPDVYPPPLSGR